MIILKATNWSNAATPDDVFEVYAEYRVNTSLTIANGTRLVMNIVGILDAAKESLTQDISIFKEVSQEALANLSKFEQQAQNEHLSIEKCVPFHSFLINYTDITVNKLENSLTIFYSSQSNLLERYICCGIPDWHSDEREFFDDLSLCDYNATCLDGVVSAIYNNFKRIQEYASNAVLDSNSSVTAAIKETSSSFNAILFEGVNEVTFLYKTVVECLVNAGLNITS